MRAITLIQPWASLIMLNEKRIETRSWPTKVRGEIAIHAGKKVDKRVFDMPFYQEVLLKHGITVSNIPTSTILCICEIVDVKRTEDMRDELSKKELAFGNFEDNRFCWVLDNVKKIKPIPDVKGMLGFWNYEF